MPKQVYYGSARIILLHITRWLNTHRVQFSRSGTVKTIDQDPCINKFIFKY